MYIGYKELYDNMTHLLYAIPNTNFTVEKRTV